MSSFDMSSKCKLKVTEGDNHVTRLLINFPNDN